MDELLADQFNAKYARQGLTCCVMNQGHLVVKMGYSFQGIDTMIQYLIDNGAYRVDREGDDLTVWIGSNESKRIERVTNTINPLVVATVLVVAVVVTAFWTQICNTIELYSS